MEYFYEYYVLPRNFNLRQMVENGTALYTPCKEMLTSTWLKWREGHE